MKIGIYGLLIMLFLGLGVSSAFQDQEKQSYEYPAGTEVTLTAVPDSGWRFSHWSGAIEGTENPITFIMDSDKGVVAHFFQVFRLELEVVGGGSIDVITSNLD